jgi:hypothetical protein
VNHGRRGAAIWKIGYRKVPIVQELLSLEVMMLLNGLLIVGLDRLIILMHLLEARFERVIEIRGNSTLVIRSVNSVPRVKGLSGGYRTIGDGWRRRGGFRLRRWGALGNSALWKQGDVSRVSINHFAIEIDIISQTLFKRDHRAFDRESELRAKPYKVELSKSAEQLCVWGPIQLSLLATRHGGKKVVLARIIFEKSRSQYNKKEQTSTMIS